MIFKWKLNRTLILGLSFTFGFLLSCSNTTYHDQRSKTFSGDSRLNMIIERGKLVAVTDIGSTSYFTYRGEPMGYQYELLQDFANYLGVSLEIHVEPDPDAALEKLNEGMYDVLAKNIVITRDRMEKVDFMNTMRQSHQVLVQRKPNNWRQMRTMEDVEKQLIRNPVGLEGKTVYVQRNSAQYYRLIHLQQEIGKKIDIVESAGKDSEDLLQLLANGEIDYTICDEYVARVAQKYYPELDVQTPVSLVQNGGWAVAKGNESLLAELNNWWDDFGNSTHALLLNDRYFNNPRGLHAGQRDYHSRKGGKLSGYDDVIRKHSAFLNWDWRLLASLIYQESRFHHDVVSHAGAFGIMQMMPATAEAYGIDSTSAPQEQIAAGVKFLQWLDTQLKKEIFNSEERQKFVLAAYNVGLAHVYDARRLAKKNNNNPNVWEGSVDYYLLNKSQPKYYRDSVVQYGYCRGEEPYKFVNEILNRYDHYKNVVRN